MEKEIRPEAFYSFIPGPPHIEWIEDSQFIHPIADYAPLEIIRHLLSFPEISILKDGKNKIHDWELLYFAESRTIGIRFSTMDGEDDAIWGGSELILHCRPVDILQLWKKLTAVFPYVYFHDFECSVYSQRAFQRLFIS